MTLAIVTLTSSGIVMTADSRQTYKNSAGAIRIGSDNAMKLFKLTDSCGVVISGRAFLNENSSSKDVGYFIKRFAKTENLTGLKVKDIAQKLDTCLGDMFVAKELADLRKQIEDMVKRNNYSDLVFSPVDGTQLPYTFTDNSGKQTSTVAWIESISMIVAGVDDDKIGRAYSVFVSKGIVGENNTLQCGAFWVGQTDVLMRIVKGYAPEIVNLDLAKEAMTKNPTTVQEQLSKLEYIINWGTITLQDAVDFCVLMTRTTESIQRFSDGTLLTPGGVPGVGRDIDVAVITPNEGFRWLKQKTLKAEGSEIDLEA